MYVVDRIIKCVMFWAVMQIRLFCQDQGKTLLGRPLNRLPYIFAMVTQNEPNSIHTKWHDTQMQRRRLFIWVQGHNSGVTRIFEWGWGANPGDWEIFLYFLLLWISYFYAFWHTSFINHIVYHGRWTNANRKVTDTSMENPDVRLLLADATRNAI